MNGTRLGDSAVEAFMNGTRLGTDRSRVLAAGPEAAGN